MIISYSPLVWEGTDKNPIRVVSSDGTGQGLVVLQALETSILRHVIFKDLKSPSDQGWQLTGAITFYESPVQILHSQFRNLNAEDALNIVRTRFLMDHNVFSEVTSDAVDLDYTSGQLSHTYFEKIGGDALDISGSEIRLENIVIQEVQDKGVSVGERSSVSINGLKVDKAKIAIAAKDQSKVHLENVELSDCEVGIAVFQKKPEYGPASVVAKGISMQRVRDNYLVEENSLCSIDDRLIEPNQKNLRAMLY